MEMIIKNVPKGLEFGTYGNYGTLIPESVKIEKFGSTHLYAVITYNYGPNDDRTIDLCHDELMGVDYESFGTTFEEELAKLGYKRIEIQKLSGGWHIIKTADGQVRPYAKYLVHFNRIFANGSISADCTHECICQGEEEAIEQTKRWERYFPIGNFVVEKIGDINE